MEMGKQAHVQSATLAAPPLADHKQRLQAQESGKQRRFHSPPLAKNNQIPRRTLAAAHRSPNFQRSESPGQAGGGNTYEMEETNRRNKIMEPSGNTKLLQGGTRGGRDLVPTLPAVRARVGVVHGRRSVEQEY